MNKEIKKEVGIRLGFITDEVSNDLLQAADFAEHFGVRNIELRSVDGLSPFQFTDEKVKEIGEICRARGLSVNAISAPLFKCDIKNDGEYRSHVEGFDRLSDQALRLGARIIRGFDFWECGASLDERAERFQPIIDICRAKDIICAIEYDPSVHSSTPKKLSEFLNYVNDSKIMALYDPGNGVFTAPDEKPYPDAYELLKDRIVNVHVKDARIVDGHAEVVKVGDGLVDWSSLFKRLIADGYRGCVTLETHYRKNVVLTEEQLKLPGGYAFSAGAYEASAESMESLLKIIDKIKEND